MKRKLFSAILFGALLTASTSGLTSCKDYDDDISNLQSQIDKLATADQLSAKVSELQAAIASAQSAAESKAAAAQSVADAASKAADAAAAAAKAAQSTADAASKDAAAAAAAAAEVQKAADKAIADLEAKAATKADLEAAAKAAEEAVKAIQEAHATDKAEIEKAINDGLDAVKAEIAKTNETLDALAKRLDACEEKLAAIEAGEGQEEALKAIQAEVEDVADTLEALGVVVSEMITDISLYTSGIADLTGFNNNLDFWQVKEAVDRSFPFGDDVKDITDGTIEFKKNALKMYDDSVLVRVNPVNAVLNADDISLVNSQGVALGKDIIEEVSVEPYQKDVPMITRAAGETGLWVVKFKANDNYDKDAFDAATKYNKKNICFAVAVKSNVLEDADRNLVTTYDLVVNNNVAQHATTFKVNNTPVAKIHNRFSAFTNQLAGTFPTSVKDIDYTWVDAKTKDITSFITPDDDKDNYNAVSNDNRQAKPTLTVEEGERISIDFDDAIAIRGFYVALDWKRAGESGNSEINAWNKYEYTNVGKISYEGKVLEAAPIQYGNHGFISVNELKDYATEGDVIGFRVWAVNLDGTMVDPDGQAFYVGVGATSEVETKTVPTTNILVTMAAAELAANPDSNKVVIELKDYLSDLNYNVVSFAGTVSEKDNDGTLNLGTGKWNADYTPTVGTGAGKDVICKLNGTKLSLQIANPTNLIDDKTYTIAATVKAQVGGAVKELRKLNIKFNKTMPKATDPIYAMDLRMYQVAEQVPNPSAINSGSWQNSVIKSWGEVAAATSGVVNILPAGVTGTNGAGVGTTGSLDLNQIYYFKNLNKKLSEAQALLKADNISYYVKGAAVGNSPVAPATTSRAKDLAAVGQSVNIPAQFINGSGYPVYAKIKYEKISHSAKDTDEDGVADKYTTRVDTDSDDDLEIKVTANTSLKAMPWSTVADGYVSYGWIKKISGIQKNAAGTAVVGRSYTDNNEVKWGNRTDYTDIDMRNVQIFYGKQLINLDNTIQSQKNLGGIETANNVVYYRPKTLPLSGYGDLNVWVEAEDGQISDYFEAAPSAYDSTNSTSVIRLTQVADRLAGNIKIYLCMELIDQLGHAEVVKLPVRIVDQETPTYMWDGSTDTTPIGIAASTSWSAATTGANPTLVRIAE